MRQRITEQSPTRNEAIRRFILGSQLGHNERTDVRSYKENWKDILAIGSLHAPDTVGAKLRVEIL